jgi:hypothetical protein
MLLLVPDFLGQTVLLSDSGKLLDLHLAAWDFFVRRSYYFQI